MSGSLTAPAAPAPAPAPRAAGAPLRPAGPGQGASGAGPATEGGRAGLAVAALYQPTVLLALALMAVIVMMILPMPAWMLDLGLAVSFALAILIFTVTLFIERPLDFSAFPTVLLASLMLRLSLNVSSTKLIIGQGHTGTSAAGGIIEGFAMFIMGGDIYLGLVIFLVLLIVNFIVITKGAGRMAEVGARFALDAMPGKQLAIDSDVAAGALSHEEAKERRRIEQEETTFFGSLDGASKFVKGDAIAGLLITLLNLVVGLAIGVGVHGLSFADAVKTYSVLTVGDGLVSQIPSVITSIAAALLLSKGSVAGPADRALFAQLGGYPAALMTVAGLLVIFALFPGLPLVPFTFGAALLGLAALVSRRLALAREEGAQGEVEEAAGAEPPQPALGDLLDVDEIHVRFASDLIDAVLDPAVGLERRIVNMRRHLAAEFGFVMPEVRLSDDAAVAPGQYAISVQGVEIARASLRPGHVLVLLRDDLPLPVPGEDVAEPVYGAPARWIPRAAQEEAAALGLPVVAPGEVIATHLLETVKGNFARLFTRRALRQLLDEFAAPSDPARAEANRRLLGEFLPDKVPYDLLQAVLRQLLDEQVPVRNLPLILEAVAEGRAAELPVEEIAEHARRRLGFVITARFLDRDGRLPVIRLGAEWDATFAEHEMEIEGRREVVLPPAEFDRLARAVGEALGTALARGVRPVLLAPARRRRFLRQVLEAKGVDIPVLSFEEVGHRTPLVLVATA